MHNSWSIIVDSLRSELQGYGGLLQLFQEQQDNLLRGDADAVLSYANEIEAQVRVVGDLREQRENHIAAFAATVGGTVDSGLRGLMPHFPEEVRPLVSALATEVNHLIHRVRRGAQRNHRLLSRVVEMHQETLRVLRPSAFTKTYSPQGQVNHSGPAHAWQQAG